MSTAGRSSHGDQSSAGSPKASGGPSETSAGSPAASARSPEASTGERLYERAKRRFPGGSSRTTLFVEPHPPYAR
ncbi:MAG TPA: hypothetical protein VIG42_10110, partial [Solirubrobacteraceae bacterium]